MKTCKRGHQREDSVINCPVCSHLRYIARKSEILECNKKWIASHKEQHLETHRAYREKNRGRIKENHKRFRTLNPLYGVWRGMQSRCYSPNNKKYKHYGGRGIKVCDRWLGECGYENFLSDMEPRPTPKHTIDRIDVNGNYEPGNCRWATLLEQRRNRRDNVMVTINGQTKCLTVWAEEAHIGQHLIRQRIKKGLSGETLLLPPDRKHQTKGNTRNASRKP